jgi:hypothetical protein
MNLSHKICQWLQSAKIRRVVVGHQPIGDAPLITLSKLGNEVYSVSLHFISLGRLSLTVAVVRLCRVMQVIQDLPCTPNKIWK